ncbi:iron chelate uptake ABC transporter family permease subunit [Nocardia sp. NPDC101769]|uniref:iron chelate uptake ABC transporter family permease subunit n=1 Tax=Nocardia sp. NPDC101769 TaxID=3364333 RepID=UPI00381DE2AE
MTDPQAPQPDSATTPGTDAPDANGAHPAAGNATNPPSGTPRNATTGHRAVEVSESEQESVAAHRFPASVDRAPAGRRSRSRTTLIFAAALAGLVVLALFSAAIGQVPTSPAEVAGSVFHRIGLDWGPLPHHPAGYVTLWEVRFPRVVLAVLVGAALATAGALLQGVFANPLAEPGVIGVSAGAAVGAGAVIVVGGAFTAAWSVAAGAFVAGLGTTLLVYLLSRSGGRTEVVTLILTGVAINAFAGGVISFLLFKASPAARDQLVFWQMGSLNGATWQAVNVVWPLTLLGIAAAIWMAPRLDLLALGESAARHLGVDVERLRRNIIVVVAVLATAGVAFTGIILFVGLIVPHLVRMLVGPGHRVLIPLSAILGAAVLVAADIGARALVHNADLPLGMITSLVGGPFFFWLLRRTRARSGGWA